MVVASFNALEKVNFGGLRLAFQIKLGVSANIDCKRAGLLYHC